MGAGVTATATAHRGRWIVNNSRLDTDIVLEIDWQGAAQVRRLMPAAISIFILPPSFDALEHRLNARAQDAPECHRTASRPMRARRSATLRSSIMLLLTDDFRAPQVDLQDIVRAERLRTVRQLARQLRLIDRLDQTH